MARLIARATTSGNIIFVGFPRQWAPLFAEFGIGAESFSEPKEYIPIASDLSDASMAAAIAQAEAHGRLRQLVEVFATSDPVVADVLYRLDRRRDLNPSKTQTKVPLTGWQSYGRVEVQRLSQEIANLAPSAHANAIVLPCARTRPYGRSKTHRRLWRGLRAEGVLPDFGETLVISSIGVVPEAFWEHPVVLHYDSGVPDIYRILRIMRSFFRKHVYDTVVDCLEFGPYRDCLSIVAREGCIKHIRGGPVRRIQRLPCP
jgi:predicted RNA-binding protein